MINVDGQDREQQLTKGKTGNPGLQGVKATSKDTRNNRQSIETSKTTLCIYIYIYWKAPYSSSKIKTF